MCFEVVKCNHKQRTEVIFHYLPWFNGYLDNNVFQNYGGWRVLFWKRQKRYWSAWGWVQGNDGIEWCVFSIVFSSLSIDSDHSAASISLCASPQTISWLMNIGHWHFFESERQFRKDSKKTEKWVSICSHVSGCFTPSDTCVVLMWMCLASAKLQMQGTNSCQCHHC